MIRVKALVDIDPYSKYKEIKEYVGARKEEGKVFRGDTFIVTKEEVERVNNLDWCKGNGPMLEVIEVIPEKEKRNEETTEVKPKKVTKKKKVK